MDSMFKRSNGTLFLPVAGVTWKARGPPGHSDSSRERREERIKGTTGERDRRRRETNDESMMAQHGRSWDGTGGKKEEGKEDDRENND